MLTANPDLMHPCIAIPNPRPTQKSGFRMVTLDLEHDRSIADLAAQDGISLCITYRWLTRYRSGEPASPAN